MKYAKWNSKFKNNTHAYIYIYTKQSSDNFLSLKKEKPDVYTHVYKTGNRNDTRITPLLPFPLYASEPKLACITGRIVSSCTMRHRQCDPKRQASSDKRLFENNGKRIKRSLIFISSPWEYPLIRWVHARRRRRWRKERPPFRFRSVRAHTHTHTVASKAYSGGEGAGCLLNTPLSREVERG